MRFESQFEKYDYIVGPSASCVSFVKENYPRVLKKRSIYANIGKIYDIEFILDVVKPNSLNASFPHKVSIHNSCHGVRELSYLHPVK